MVDLDWKANGYFKYFCLKNIITLRVCNKWWLIKYEQGRRGDHGTKGGQGTDGQKGDKVSAQRKLYHELQPLQSYIFCIAHGTRPAWQSCRKYSTTEFLLNSTQLGPINMERNKRSESQETSNCEILNKLSCSVDLGMFFKSLLGFSFSRERTWNFYLTVCCCSSLPNKVLRKIPHIFQN